MRALSAGCIFMACKQANIDIDLAWMIYEMMGDMVQPLEILWVIEHLVAGVEPTVELPAVRYKQAKQVGKRSNRNQSILKCGNKS